MQVEKIPEPWPPFTNGSATTAHSATTPSRRVVNMRRNPRAGEAWRENFFNLGPKFAPTGNRTQDLEGVIRSSCQYIESP
jgi:hypothetical protein